VGGKRGRAAGRRRFTGRLRTRDCAALALDLFASLDKAAERLYICGS